MTTSARASSPWILWPFAALLDLVAFLLRLTGRLVGIVLALVLIGLGTLFSLTIVLLPIGVPLLLVGFVLLIRCIV